MKRGLGVGITSGVTQPHFHLWPKRGPGFQTQPAMVFLC